MNQADIKVFPDSAALAAAASQRVVAAGNESIALTDRFTIALAGGSTPKALYQLLAAEPMRSAIDWAKVEVFFGDERCVPPDHPESNFRMARETLLSKVPIPGDNIYRMRGEIDPQEAAKEYGRMLKGKFGEEGGPDLVLLGLGEDGHTLSLFPGTPAVNETHHRCVANYAEHSTTGKSWRITLTAPFVNRSREVLFLIAGASKAEALSAVLEGPRDPQRWPAQLIQPVSGRLTWMVDAEAAGMNRAD